MDQGTKVGRFQLLSNTIPNLYIVIEGRKRAICVFADPL